MIFMFSFFDSFEQHRSLIIEKVNIIDIESGRVLPRRYLEIREGRIQNISNRKINSEGKIINAEGKFVLPGLWDMHVHIRKDEQIFFNLLLANGVTAVRDMHNPFHCNDAGAWKDSINSLPVAPRVISVAGCIVDGPGDSRGWSFHQISSVEESRSVIRTLKNGGADFVKIYSNVSPAVYESIIAEARVLKLPLSGHIPNGVTASACIESGQRTIEHLDVFHRACSDMEANLIESLVTTKVRNYKFSLDFFQSAYRSFDDEKAKGIARLMKKHGVAVCPTLRTSKAINLADFLLSPTGQKAFDAVPRFVNERFKPDSWKAVSSTDSLFWVQLFEREKQILKLFAEEEVQIVAGTDASAMRYTIPGYSLVDELQLYVEAGLTPLQSLQTATINPARFMNVGDDFGTIAIGKKADFVILNANPLEDINNLKHVDMVVLKGEPYSRKELDQLVAEADLLCRDK